MKRSMQQPLPPMEVTPVDGTTSPTVTEGDRSREWLTLVTRALGRAGVSHKAAAADMQIDRGLLSAQLAGASGKHLSWLRMGALPPAFWRELILLILDFHDITVGSTQQDADDAAIGRLIRDVVSRCR